MGLKSTKQLRVTPVMSARLSLLHFLAPRPVSLIAATAFAAHAPAADFKPDRCEIVPLPDRQVSFRIDGVEKFRWHHDEQYPRPFFFPFNGPSGETLTRMGHPGAQNHDHHRSVWFAHHDVNGCDFWGDPRSGGRFGRIEQKLWLAYADGDSEALMATLAGWRDDSDKEVMEQETVAALIPLPNREHLLEIQLTFRPPAKAEKVELGKTNFGFLAVRVAKTLSVHFGGGQIRNSEEQTGEPEIFGQRARWMDYSGPMVAGSGPGRRVMTEGVTYFDHPSNPRHPTKWHVREDGWMGASFCMDEGLTITPDAPLTLRYLLHSHAGDYKPAKADKAFQEFAARPGFEVFKSKAKHRQYEVRRVGTK